MNPSVTLADLGLLSVLVGALIIVFGLDRKRTSHSGDGGGLVATGWVILSAGLFVALGAFLLLNQVMCAEACDLSAYWAPIYGGLLMATVGLAVLFVGRLSGSRWTRGQGKR